MTSQTMDRTSENTARIWDIHTQDDTTPQNTKWNDSYFINKVCIIYILQLHIILQDFGKVCGVCAISRLYINIYIDGIGGKERQTIPSRIVRELFRFKTN